MLRTTAQNNIANMYSDGNPLAVPPVPATTLPAADVNRFQEELVSPVLGTGQTLDGANNQQLLEAIKRLTGARTTTVTGLSGGTTKNLDWASTGVVLVDATAGAVILTLPVGAALANGGMIYSIMRIDPGAANAVALKSTGTDTILDDGGSAVNPVTGLLLDYLSSYDATWDGAQWRVREVNRDRGRNVAGGFGGLDSGAQVPLSQSRMGASSYQGLVAVRGSTNTKDKVSINQLYVEGIDMGSLTTNVAGGTNTPNGGLFAYPATEVDVTVAAAITTSGGAITGVTNGHDTASLSAGFLHRWGVAIVKNDSSNTVWFMLVYSQNVSNGTNYGSFPTQPSLAIPAGYSARYAYLGPQYYNTTGPTLLAWVQRDNKVSVPVATFIIANTTGGNTYNTASYTNLASAQLPPNAKRVSTIISMNSTGAETGLMFCATSSTPPTGESGQRLRAETTGVSMTASCDINLAADGSLAWYHNGSATTHPTDVSLEAFEY